MIKRHAAALAKAPKATRTILRELRDKYRKKNEKSLISKELTQLTSPEEIKAKILSLELLVDQDLKIQKSLEAAPAAANWKEAHRNLDMRFASKARQKRWRQQIKVLNEKLHQL